MATLQSGKCFTVPTFFGLCCRSELQERMYIYKWHEVDQTKHEIFCVHIVCNEIQVKVNLEITTFFFYLHFPYCPNFFWFGVVVSASDVTPTERWLNVWCIWHTKVETLQDFRSRPLICWIIQDFRETCVSRSLTFRLETKMPWHQTLSRKKKAVVFTTVMTNAYQDLHLHLHLCI